MDSQSNLDFSGEDYHLDTLLELDATPFFDQSVEVHVDQNDGILKCLNHNVITLQDVTGVFYENQQDDSQLVSVAFYQGQLYNIHDTEVIDIAAVKRVLIYID
jgi:hypothetical protein